MSFACTPTNKDQAAAEFPPSSIPSISTNKDQEAPVSLSFSILLAVSSSHIHVARSKGLAAPSSSSNVASFRPLQFPLFPPTRIKKLRMLRFLYSGGRQARLGARPFPKLGHSVVESVENGVSSRLGAGPFPKLGHPVVESVGTGVSLEQLPCRAQMPFPPRCQLHIPDTDTFTMADAAPKATGLPMVVYVCIKNANHGPVSKCQRGMELRSPLDTGLPSRLRRSHVSLDRQVRSRMKTCNW